MKKFLWRGSRSQDGFSLVEVLVTAGILGGLSVIYMRLAETQIKTSKTVESRYETTAILNDIRTVLSSPGSCLESFSNNPVSPGVPFAYNQGVLPDPVGLRLVRGAATTDRFMANSDENLAQAYGNGAIKILSYSLDDTDPTVGIAPGETIGTTHLIVEFYRGKGVMGQESITRKIVLNVERVSPGDNSIRDCNIAPVGLGPMSCSLLQGVYSAGPPSRCDLGLYRDPSANDQRDYAISENYIRDMLLLDDDMGTLTIGNSSVADVVTINAATTISGNTVISDGFTFSMVSDKKLKDDIQELGPVLQSISNLHGVQFSWKSNGRPDIGLIAQEVQKEFPLLVLKDKKTGTLSVKYAQLIAVTIQAIKELNEKNRLLEKENQELMIKGRVQEEKIDLMAKGLCQINPTMEICKYHND